MNNIGPKITYNKLTILSAISLLYSLIIPLIDFPLYKILLDKLYNIDYTFYVSYFNMINYLDILFYFLEISIYLSLVISIITGIVGLIKIRKTNEKGGVIALFSVNISTLLLFAYIYADWGL